MPINMGALGAEPTPEEEPAKKPRAKRRTKAELIADARLIPLDEMVEVKFAATGTKAERDWATAVELFRDDKVEFVDKTLKYSVEKMDQSGDPAAASDPVNTDGLLTRWSELQARLDSINPTGADQLEYETLTEEAALVRKQITDAGGTDPESDDGYLERNPEAKSTTPPEGAEVGDEVVFNGNTSYVGHGMVMTQVRPVKAGTDAVIPCQHRWEWTDDGWEAHKISNDVDAPAKKAPAKAAPKPAPMVEREVFEHAPEQISTTIWKVSMGYLETVGLPDYSNLKIGPANAQRQVVDDGRRTTVTMGGREVSLPTSVIEAQQECAQVCEYVMRAERQAMIHFLESVRPGSTTPQS